MNIPSPISKILEKADIRINGDRPWDIRIHNEQMLTRVLLQGSLGLGESYMDGQWDCDRLDEFITQLARSEAHAGLPINARVIMEWVRYRLLNPQTVTGSKKVAREHYDLGNDFYENMLDPYMQYSCGYFKDTDNLATAQEQKLDLICRKLGLAKGMKLLDIGCGWGGLARFAAERYGVEVTGITISKQQASYARDHVKELPIDIQERDYREIQGTFDRVVSVGMFEHVGPKNYDTYMRTVKKVLTDDGLALIHSIVRNRELGGAEPWMEKYIFPNSILPSLGQFVRAAQSYFVIEDGHNFGASYDKTLMAWHANFEENWDQFKDRYGDRFYRMWNYYLLSCAGAFRARSIQLWQLVLSPHGVPGGYQSIR
jgi:cyclopropane-fatty-acyl-phospholipid synthase